MGCLQVLLKLKGKSMVSAFNKPKIIRGDTDRPQREADNWCDIDTDCDGSTYDLPRMVKKGISTESALDTS